MSTREDYGQHASTSLERYERLHERRNRPQPPPTTSCAKRSVLFGNLAFLLLSVGMIAAGYYLHAKTETSLTNRQLGTGLMILGSVAAVISFLGCCGAWRQSRCLVLLFAFVLFLIIICQVGIGAFLVTQGSRARTIVADRWMDTTPENRIELQNDFTCCGLFSYNDTYHEDPCPTDAPHDQGCIDVIDSRLRDQYWVVGGIAIGIAAIEILGFVCACVLACELKGPTPEDDEERRLREAKEYNRAAQQV